MMVKNTLILCLTFLLIIISCQNKKKPDRKEAVVSNRKNSLIKDHPENTQIKDLPVNDMTDSVSYALGVAWGNGINKLGLSTISPAFYLGARDLIYNNKSVMDLQKAASLLEDKFEQLRFESGWPEIEMDMKLSQIKLLTSFDTVSYALGYTWCNGAKAYGVKEINASLLLGLKQKLSGENTLFTYEQADSYLRTLIEKEREIIYADQKEMNERWLEENKQKKGVITLESGLQYKVIKEGKGISPSGMDIIEAHYTGKLIDGEMFDSSFSRGEPLKFYPTGVIKGWIEATRLMKEGDIWEIYVPHYLGYGSGGTKGKIPPYSTLIFELELIKVHKE